MNRPLLCLLRILLFSCALITVIWSYRVGLISSHSIRMATSWSMLIQLCYFSCALVMELLGALHSARTALVLAYFRHAVLVVALGMEAIFWTVSFYDPRMIHTGATSVSPLLNHLQHTVPLLLILVDCLLPPSLILKKRLAVATTLVATSAYLLTIYLKYLETATWPYRFMESLDTGPFPGFLVVIAAFISACSLALAFVDGRIRTWVSDRAVWKAG